MKIRKQIYDLTLEDIRQFPVWEYALDEEGTRGQNEATVRPVKQSDMDPSSSSSKVRARFTLADGTEELGFVTITDRPHDGIISIKGDTHRNSKRQPVIITPRGQVVFYFGAMKPRANDIADCYHTLGDKKAVAVFPITYATDVDVPAGLVEGQIGGFQYLEDTGKTLEFVIREVQ
jgi:hypothetical protein